MEYKEFLHDAAQKLKNAGILTANLDVRALFEVAYSYSREDMVRGDIQLEDEKTALFEEFIARRIKREPVSSILNRKEFWSLDFITTEDTLDPRPDSETLIETALKFFPDKNTNLNVLDLGTGTGCLVLSFLSEYQNGKGFGIDISEKAVEVAKKNASNLGLDGRVDFALGNWGEGLNEKYNLIISNPPYIESKEIVNLEDEVSQYDPHLALDGGIDGLKCYRKIASHLPKLLTENGVAILEIGEGQERDIASIMEEVGVKNITQERDLSGIIRCLVVNI